MYHHRYGVINDIHGPYEDPRSLTLILDIFEDQNIDTLFINGDLIDFYWIHGHGSKDPAIQGNLEEEFIWAQDFISRIRTKFVLKGTKIILNYGNHEDRLNRYVIDKCPAFWNYLTLEKMLRLEENDIEWYPYNTSYQLVGTNFRLQHSPPSYGVNTARTSILKKPASSYMWACTHRKDYAAITSENGQVFEGWSNGCVTSSKLSESHRKVFSYAKGHENWQQCAAIIDVIGSTPIVNQFSIYWKGEARFTVVNGHYYEA